MDRTPSQHVSTVRHEDRTPGAKETRSRGDLRSGLSVLTTFRWSDSEYEKNAAAPRDARRAVPCLRGEA